MASRSVILPPTSTIIFRSNNQSSSSSSSSLSQFLRYRRSTTRNSCFSLIRRSCFSISATASSSSSLQEQAAPAPAPPNQVRVRFAPSPTGNLHVGGARTALFNYLFARYPSFLPLCLFSLLFFLKLDLGQISNITSFVSTRGEVLNPVCNVPV